MPEPKPKPAAKPAAKRKRAPKPKAQPQAPVEAIIKAPAKPRLTDKQRVWAFHYIQHWNATKAARQAGYADPECSGFENRQNPVISEFVEARIAMDAMSAGEVLRRLTDQARGRHADYWEFWHPRDAEWESADETEMGDDELDFRDRQRTKDELLKRLPHLNIERMIADGKGHLIKKFKAEAGMLTEVEFYDSQAALIALGRHHKLFTDRIEADVTAKPISHDDTKPYEEWDRAALNRGIDEALKAAGSGQ